MDNIEVLQDHMFQSGIYTDIKQLLRLNKNNFFFMLFLQSFQNSCYILQVDPELLLFFIVSDKFECFSERLGDF